MISAALGCHPQTHSQAVRKIRVDLQWTRKGSLALAYVVEGEVARLAMPAPKPSQRGERLWEHTCFEAFIAAKGSAAYYELNFSPSTEWAAYAFVGYRAAAHAVGKLNPRVTMNASKDRLELRGLVRLQLLGGMQAEATLRLGLSAVIEEKDGKKTFWSLRHPPGKPDFHHPDAFALELSAPHMDGASDPGYTSRS